MSTGTAVILAAGRGSRLDPELADERAQPAQPVAGAGEDYSKPLVQLGDETLLQRTVRCLHEAGATRVIVVTGYRADLVEAELARRPRAGLAVETVHNEEWTKSNGLSLYCCRHHIDGDERFLLSMADHLFEPSIARDLAAFELPADAVALAVDFKVDEVFDLDDATKVRVERGRIVAIDKKLDDYNAIDCGLFLCSPAVFAALGGAMVDGDCSLSDGMRALGGRGKLLPFDIGARRWQDVDTPEMLEQAATLVGSGDDAEG